MAQLEENVSMQTEAFRQDVINARKELNISQKQLSKDANCSTYAVRSLEEGITRHITKRTMTRLCDALGLDPSQYIDAAVPSMEEEEQHPAVEQPVLPAKPKKCNPSSLEVKLLRLKDENAELKQQAELKGLYLQERINEVNALKEKLKEDEQIIDSLLIYVQRLKAGEIVG